MSENKTDKQYGLRLTLGNAPASPHVVVGVPGLYRPDRVTPVGGPNEADLETAKQLDKDKGSALKLVEISPGDVDALREAHLADLKAARQAAATNLSVVNGAEVEQLKDELGAVKAING